MGQKGTLTSNINVLSKINKIMHGKLKSQQQI